MSVTSTEYIAAEDPATENGSTKQEKAPTLPVADEADWALATCEHIRPGGARCGSPALRDQKLCFYHSKVRKTVPKNNLFLFLANPGRKENDPHYAFEFPDLDDVAGLQIAFMQFIYGVAQHRIEEWRARMILSALHGAAANVRLMAKTEQLAKSRAQASREQDTHSPKKEFASAKVVDVAEEQGK